MKALVTQEPALGHGRFVGAVVVEDEMQVEGRENVGIDAP